MCLLINLLGLRVAKLSQAKLNLEKLRSIFRFRSLGKSFVTDIMKNKKKQYLI